MFFKHLQQTQDIAKQVRDAIRRKVISHIRQPQKLLEHQGLSHWVFREQWVRGVIPNIFQEKQQEKVSQKR